MIYRSLLPLLTFLLLTRTAGRADSPGDLPLHLPPHPRLMLTDAEVPAVKARLARAPFLQARYRLLLRSADGWVRKGVDLPPRGGQWSHWYVCKRDGTDLKTVSPTEHRCPSCGTVYHGWPYDDVLLMKTHNGYSSAVRDLGLAHRLTGEKKYADKAREILLAYARAYTRYPLHDKNGQEKVGGGHVGPQTLDEAGWLIGISRGPTWSGTVSARTNGRRSRPACCAPRRRRSGGTGWAFTTSRTGRTRPSGWWAFCSATRSWWPTR